MVTIDKEGGPAHPRDGNGKQSKRFNRKMPWPELSEVGRDRRARRWSYNDRKIGFYVSRLRPSKTRSASPA